MAFSVSNIQMTNLSSVPITITLNSVLEVWLKDQATFVAYTYTCTETPFNLLRMVSKTTATYLKAVWCFLHFCDETPRGMWCLILAFDFYSIVFMLTNNQQQTTDTNSINVKQGKTKEKNHLIIHFLICARFIGILVSRIWFKVFDIWIKFVHTTLVCNNWPTSRLWGWRS